MIRHENLDLAAKHFATGIFHGHLRRNDRSRSGEIGKDAGLIVHDADLERLCREREPCRPHQKTNRQQ